MQKPTPGYLRQHEVGSSFLAKSIFAGTSANDISAGIETRRIMSDLVVARTSAATGAVSLMKTQLNASHGVTWERHRF